MHGDRRGVVLITLAILAALSTDGRAQRVPPVFERYTVDEGLSQNFVTAIAQDRQGFLWFGTQDGLNRFDGYGFTTYRRVPNDASSLSDNAVTALSVDRDGVVWVGTAAGGLNAYTPRTNSFVRYQHLAEAVGGLSADRVFATHVDRSGRLWVSTSAGLDYLDAGTAAFGHYVHVPGRDQTLPADVIGVIREDPRGNLVFGTSMGLFSRKGDRFVPIHLKTHERLITRYEVHSLAFDLDDHLWIGTESGVTRVVWTAVFETLPAAGPATAIASLTGLVPGGQSVTAIEATLAGELWLGGHAGVFAYHEASGALTRSGIQIGGASAVGGLVTAVLRDRSGVLWLGSNGAGVTKASAALDRFAHLVPSSGNRSTRAILEDREGALWIGGYAGLARFERGSTEALISSYVGPAARGAAGPTTIRVLYEDPRAPYAVWVGTEGGRILAFDRASARFLEFDPLVHDSGATRRILHAVYRDSNGNLWVGSTLGLHRADEVRRKLVPVLIGRPADPVPEVHAIIEVRSRPGWLWLAASDGLHLVDPAGGRRRHFARVPDAPHTLSHENLSCILEDREGRVWIGSQLGLNRVVFDGASAEPARFQRLTVEDGLPNDRIYGLLEDRRGDIWISTNRGLSRMNPATVHFRNYDQSNGLQSNEFNSGAYHRGRDGRLYFGGVNGVTAFDPDAITDSTFRPPVVLTGLQVFNRPVTAGGARRSLDSEIAVASLVRLAHEDKVVTFEFAALDFTAPARNRYACKLEGLSDDWLELGTQRRATYTSLPAGSYTLLVRGSNSDGVWNPVPTSLRVIVAPPYWQTWWFRLIIALAAVCVGYAVHWGRTRTIRLRNVSLQQEVERRTRTEAALAAAEERYRTIVDGALFGIFQSTPDGRYVSVNPAMAAMLGYDSPAELMGAVTNIAGQVYVHPEERAALHDQLQARGEVRAFPGTLRRRDCTEISIIQTVRLVSLGDIVCYEGMVEDVTARRNLEEQLAQAQKMESIGRLAGGVAHDFNNMLTVIDGYSEMALDEARGTPGEEYLGHVRTASDTARRLTGQLLAFARRQIIQPVVLSPNELLRRFEPLLRQLVGEDIVLHVDVQDDVWSVRIDPNQFEQIMLNLAANARDAMPAGGLLRVGTRNVVIEADDAAAQTGVSVGEYVMLTVSDDGIGIERPVLDRIFEPFFSTKEKGKGTGLGLATVFGIVTQHGGHVRASSEPGRGSTFSLYFPRVEDAPQAAAAETAHRADARGRPAETVLVVEDEDLVRALAGRTLRAAGYAVLEAADGPSALDLVRRHEGPLNLVVTDVVMPRMSGRELAKNLGRIRPGVPVLYTSGYTEDMIAHHGVLDAGIDFLPKPYGPRELATRVRDLLDRRV